MLVSSQIRLLDSFRVGSSSRSSLLLPMFASTFLSRRCESSVAYCVCRSNSFSFFSNEAGILTPCTVSSIDCLSVFSTCSELVTALRKCVYNCVLSPLMLGDAKGEVMGECADAANSLCDRCLSGVVPVLECCCINDVSVWAGSTDK